MIMFDFLFFNDILLFFSLLLHFSLSSPGPCIVGISLDEVPLSWSTTFVIDGL